ncbi:hypothetical protein WN51_13436 [Melipona quadrifasciata]|uniref:Uncharacterized protein n=1 Tax=Melipona quadrifasciata TaxID=166423 RepID=A0A0M9A0H8_9HYME|nr:hypothetical protein WN51_13436 [Melipona quadrifasciata]
MAASSPPPFRALCSESASCFVSGNGAPVHPPRSMSFGEGSIEDPAKDLAVNLDDDRQLKGAKEALRRRIWENAAKQTKKEEGGKETNEGYERREAEFVRFVAAGQTTPKPVRNSLGFDSVGKYETKDEDRGNVEYVGHGNATPAGIEMIYGPRYWTKGHREEAEKLTSQEASEGLETPLLKEDRESGKEYRELQSIAMETERVKILIERICCF